MQHASRVVCVVCGRRVQQAGAAGAARRRGGAAARRRGGAAARRRGGAAARRRGGATRTTAPKREGSAFSAPASASAPAESACAAVRAGSQ